MFALRCTSFLNFAAVASLVVGSLATPGRSDELVQSLGPVAPHEPILTKVGDKRVVAFYSPGSRRCALHAVVWDNSEDGTEISAARVRVSLEPGQVVHIDSAENESVNLQCGSNAADLAVVDDKEFVAFGITTEPSTQSTMDASAFRY
jgi:hypothetical protein